MASGCKVKIAQGGNNPANGGNTMNVTQKRARLAQAMKEKRQRYAWIITKDHFSDPAYGDPDMAGARGPRGCRLTGAEAKALATCGHVFELLDDDGERMARGRFVSTIDVDNETCDLEEYAFGPLDDFGLPYYGATTIRYRNAAGKMEVL